MKDSITVLLNHVNATLPDSVTARRELLEAMLTVMRSKHPARAEVEAQLSSITAAAHLNEAAQMKFAAMLKGNSR